MFTLVVLGESIVVTVGGLDTGSRLDAAMVAVLGFVIAATIWWLYFGIFRSMPVDHGFLGRLVWAQGHLLVFAGISAGAVGIEFATEAAADSRPLELADRLPLGAGIGAYLVALAAIRAVNRRIDWVVGLRMFGATGILIVTGAGLGLAPLSFVATIAVVLVAEAAIELARSAPSAPGASSAT